MWFNDTPKLKDCRLWDGTLEVYIHGYSFTLISVGDEILSGDTRIDADLRIGYALDRTGVRYLFYKSPEGFKRIVLE